MGVRFGRRASDGTTEYYDSRQELVAAATREQENELTAQFGFGGLLLGGLLTYALVHIVGGEQWPKVFRFSAVLFGAGITSYVLAKFANAIATAFAYILVMVFLFGIGALIWRFV